MLTADLIAVLQSPRGADLLREAAELPGDTLARLTRLRKRWPAELAAAAVETLELRVRAQDKFDSAREMFFTREGLEQSSGDATARWRASRFPVGSPVVDLCCGIGGDTTALAARGPVVALDRDPAAARCARRNAEVRGVGGAVRVACADVTAMRLAAAYKDHARPGVLFDPSRRPGGRRVRSAALYSPPLELGRALREYASCLAIKVSPALDEAEIEAATGSGGRIEFVSYRGECKEAVVWFGDAGRVAVRSAAVLSGCDGRASVLAASTDAPAPDMSPPRQWLFEPDPAVIRAHLVREVAALLCAAQLDPQIAYLTADHARECPFVTSYRVLDWMPFSLRRVQESLRSAGRRVAAIKRRGVPLAPEELAGRLTGAGDKPVVVVLTRVRGEPAAVVCSPSRDS